MMKVLIVLFVIALGYGVYLVWFQSRISGAEARALVAGESALLVDVRSPEEFARGHLEGALNVPVYDLDQRLRELPADRPLVLYCRSGARSAKAVRVLKAAGLRRVYNLGPMSAW